MLAVVPQPTFRSLPLRAPDRRARRCTEPSLGADRPSPEHKPAAAPRLLSRTRPSGEVVPRAQARVVQREVRDRRITARGVKPNALALLGRSCPPTTPHRFLLVGGSRRFVMRSIPWIGSIWYGDRIYRGGAVKDYSGQQIGSQAAIGATTRLCFGAQ